MTEISGGTSMRRIHLVTAALACSASLLVAGCGDDTSEAGPSTEQSESSEADSPTPSSDAPPEADLEAYAAQAEQASKSMLGASITKLYKSFDIEPDPPSGIEYVYVFRKPVDLEQARKGMQSQASVLRSSFRSQIAPEMERQGFEDPTATWTYLNPDGTEIFSQKFS